MLKLLLLLRLPVALVGAIIGGWLAGHLYLRAVWAWLRRQVERQR